MTTSKVIIRPFAPEDQRAARSLILTGLGEHFGFIDETCNPDLDDIRQHYLAKGARFIVVEADGKLIGTGALIRHNAVLCQMVRVSVASQYRRSGIGRRIVEYLVAEARRSGFARLMVETNKDWYNAIGLYQSCGFLQYDEDDISVYLKLDLHEDFP
jgi:N-acetylglutamate synthase-like GNAT family acetyltransferase